MPFCPTCGTEIAEGAACPKCAPTAPPYTAAPTGAGLTDNMAGLLAYITVIPAIVFLVVEPFNKRSFVRFHAFQSLFFFIAWIVIGVALSIVSVPLLWTLVRLAMFVLWIILMLKAYQGQRFKLPVIGDLAAQQAGS